MVQINLIKGLIKEHGETLDDFAKVIDRSVQTVQERFKGKTSFTIDEALAVKLYYNLSDERFLDIFFKK